MNNEQERIHINNSLLTRRETANDRLRSLSQAATHKTLGCSVGKLIEKIFN